MTQLPEIEVRAALSLAFMGTSITVDSVETALDLMKRQAFTVGRPQNLLLRSTPPRMVCVDTEPTDIPLTTADATLSASTWSLIVNGTVKLTLPTPEPLISRAKLLAAHQKVDHILFTSPGGTTRIKLEENPSPTKNTPTPTTHDAPPPAPTNTTEHPPIAELPIPTAPPPEHPQREDAPQLEPQNPATDENSIWFAKDHPHEIDDEPEQAPQQPRVFPRRALLVGLSAAAVLGVGSFAASKLRGTSKTSPPPTPQVPTPAPLEPPFPGVEPEPIQQFPMAYSDLALSAKGEFLAVQISDTEISIQRTITTGTEPDPGIKDSELLRFDGKLAPPILPLGAPYGEGFIFRILNTSGDLAASSKLIVWTPKNGAITHELPIGSQLTSRGGHSWISSTIPTTAPRTVHAITATTLEKYVAPSYGPALFSLLPTSTALWASIETDNNASILTTTAQGKISATGILKRPEKSAVVAKWITATADHALMLWKNTDGYVLALHETKNGKISTKTDFKLPEGTTAERLQTRSTPEGNIVILENIWADLKTGKFGAPDGIDLNTVEARPRHGGFELRTNTETKFRPDTGPTFSVPHQSTVLAVTKEAVIVEESRLISVYRKTTTEGK